MTDARLFQAATVAPVSAPSDAQIMQIAVVAVQKEIPPIAGGARIYQMAIVTVSKEFVIPVVFAPVACGQFMQTMPYYIMPFPGE